MIKEGKEMTCLQIQILIKLKLYNIIYKVNRCPKSLKAQGIYEVIYIFAPKTKIIKFVS